MKRFISLLFALVFAVSVAAADLDLSGMKYDELIALQRQLVAEIMSRPEWKEVTVPAGKWEIGEDIPAGKYSITAASSSIFVDIKTKNGGDFLFQYLSKKGDAIGKVTLEKGYSLDISGPVVFAPVALLGF